LVAVPAIAEGRRGHTVSRGYSWVRIYGTFAIGAFLFSLLVSVNRYFRQYDLGLKPVPFATSFALELGVYLSVVCVSPLVVAFCRRYPVRGQHWLRHLLVQLLGCAPTAILVTVSLLTIFREPFDPESQGALVFTTMQYFRSYFDMFLLYYVAMAMIWHAADYAGRERDLAAHLAQTRIEQLDAQMQPHFLFNSLHGVSAMMDHDVEGARTMLVRLSNLLRSAYDSKEENLVPLRVEVGWLLGSLAL